MTTKAYRYQEFKPLKRVIIFDNPMDYRKFFDEYFRKILDECWAKGINYKEVYAYQLDKLNKDGSIRKKIERPTWLWTKKAQENQKKGWTEYIEKRKKKTREKHLSKKIAELEVEIKQKQAELEELKLELNKQGENKNENQS